MYMQHKAEMMWVGCMDLGMFMVYMLKLKYIKLMIQKGPCIFASFEIHVLVGQLKETVWLRNSFWFNKFKQIRCQESSFFYLFLAAKTALQVLMSVCPCVCPWSI